AAVAASEAKLAAANTQVVMAKTNVDKANGELAGVQKLVTDATNTATAAKAAVAPSKAEVDKQTAMLTAAQTAEAARVMTAQVLAEAAAKIQDAANKAPQNAELKGQAAKVAEIVKAANGEMDAAKKQTATVGVAVKAATDKYNLVVKTAGDTATAQAATAQKYAAEQAARKPIFDALGTAQGAVTAATAEVTAAKAKLAGLKK
ncbi:MAG: hypothetical protein ACRCZF_06605, partial [Gemmataceae bacterium]